MPPIFSIVPLIQVMNAAISIYWSKTFSCENKLSWYSQKEHWSQIFQVILKHREDNYWSITFPHWSDPAVLTRPTNIPSSVVRAPPLSPCGFWYIGWMYYLPECIFVFFSKQVFLSHLTCAVCVATSTKDSLNVAEPILLHILHAVWLCYDWNLGQADMGFKARIQWRFATLASRRTSE